MTGLMAMVRAYADCTMFQASLGREEEVYQRKMK